MPVSPTQDDVDRFNVLMDKHQFNKTNDQYEGTFHQYVRVQRQLENQKTKPNLQGSPGDKPAKDKQNPALSKNARAAKSQPEPYYSKAIKAMNRARGLID